MKNSWLNFAALVLLLFFSACSIQQNTWMSRHYQELNTRYNVYFNGNEAYKQGLTILKAGTRDNFTSLLPMYPVSNHPSAKMTASSMNKVVEKCQKAIKKHSIRVKPAQKPTSRSRESYKRFYSQEEFNPFMDEVFLLMATAQFHMADFNSCAATSAYIMRHFSTNRKASDEAAILLARSYKELGWMYDAENLLRSLNTPSLSPSVNGIYAAAYADFQIASSNYPEAIPYLELAIKNSRNRIEKQRWTFLLAQLHQDLGQKKQAYDEYKRILGMNPPYAMEISARILQTEVFPDGNPAAALKKLKRMTKSDKNKDYLDQIYYAIGNLYLAEKDTVKAFENYQLAVDNSVRSGPTRIKIQLTFGNLLYLKGDFIRAFTCYSKAAPLLKKEDERYEQATFRNTVLKSLVPPLTIIHNEDSLLKLSTMPEKKLNLLVDSLVEVAKKKAKEEQRKKNAAEAVNRDLATNQQTPTDQQPLADPTDKSWYFYNPSIVTKGFNEFQNKWGKRDLADDWRRNKKTPLFESSTTASAALRTDTSTTIHAAKDSLAANRDSLAKKVNKYAEGGNSPLNRNYYLKNIPFTPEQKAAVGERLAPAMLKAGTVYRELMGNDRLALTMFKELELRYPDSKEMEMAWYVSHLLFKQANRQPEAEEVRIKLVKTFPKGELAGRLSDPLFVEHLIEMYAIQDSLYAETYRHFTLHHEDSVFSNSQLVKKRYPLSDLMPRFIFLESLELGRTGHDSAFFDSLTYIVKKYPKSEVAPVAKSMLSLWKKGMRPAVSKGYTSLLEKRTNETAVNAFSMDSLVAKLTYSPETSHVLLIAYSPDSVNANRLQFDVALYNFTTFLIRDYDVSLAKIGQMNVLLVQGFENAADVLRYQSWINFQNQSPYEKYPGIRLIAVSTKNLELLEEGLDAERYLKFFNSRYKTDTINP